MSVAPKKKRLYGDTVMLRGTGTGRIIIIFLKIQRQQHKPERILILRLNIDDYNYKIRLSGSYSPPGSPIKMLLCLVCTLSVFVIFLVSGLHPPYRPESRRQQKVQL